MEEIIIPTGEQFEMQASPRGLVVKPLYVNYGYRSTAVKSVQREKQVPNYTEDETRHFDDCYSNVYDHLNFEKATEPLKPAKESNRALLGLVIIVGLISLTALLLTLLMLSRTIGPFNEGQCISWLMIT